MKNLQQDDVQDWLNKPKIKWRWIDVVSKNIVRAENKKQALKQFKLQHNIITAKKNIINL